MNRIGTLQTRLEDRANPRTKAWWERYLKNVIQFRGVKMADIRAALHTWIDEEGIDDEFSGADQKELALGLLRAEYAEDKLAGILYLQEVLLPESVIDWRTDLSRFASLFQDGYIYDWNTSDWFCVKVLGPLAEREGEKCARSIAEWRNSENLWQRRAAGVAFVNVAKYGDANFPDFTDMLLEVCSAAVQHEERFAQTGAGWVLRELSLAEPERVSAFVEDHFDRFSSEGLRYATEKLDPESQAYLGGRRDR